VLAHIIGVLAAAWAGWILLNLVLLVVSAFLITPDAPCFNGFRIIIPAWLSTKLTPAEVAAVIAHEEGHRHHRHIWENFARVCLFSAPTLGRRREQEDEADDFAIADGHARALASALVKLGPTENSRLCRILRAT
jgi:Zn-dependent protease with chaperone function